ncbi:MAG: hypothetical protein JWQ21_2660 [Herminiimonas sp.]|nr:hypothetical protein [Herminiimonas sp.]
MALNMNPIFGLCRRPEGQPELMVRLMVYGLLCLTNIF